MSWPRDCVEPVSVRTTSTSVNGGSGDSSAIQCLIDGFDQSIEKRSLRYEKETSSGQLSEISRC